MLYLNLLKYFFETRRWQKLSVEKVKELQLKKFVKLFEHAKGNSILYEELYKKKEVYDLKIKSYKDIDKIPLVDKDILRKYPTEHIMTVPSGTDINFHSTSGSTGEPFRIASNKYEDYSSHVRFTNILMQHGYTPFKKMVLLSRYEPGHNFELEEDLNLISFLQKKTGIFKRVVVSIFQSAELIVEILTRESPYVLWSTPSVIEMVALELEKEDRRLNIPLLVLMSETISPKQSALFRRRICKSFIDVYGLMESPTIGYSYNNTDYKHIINNSTLVEVINRRNYDGKIVGDLVITNLVNKTMPFIRYKTGDYVEVLKGEDFPIKTIGKIHGRLDDILILRNGQTFLFHHSYELLRNFHEAQQYKFIQLGNGDLILRLKLYKNSERKQVESKVKDIWNKKYNGIPLFVEFVEEFKIDKKTGKFKVIEKLKDEQ